MRDMWTMYELSRAAEGLSPRTLEKFRWAWLSFIRHVDKPTEQTVAEWHKSMFDRGLKKNTVRTQATVIYGFLKWCKARGYIDFEPPKPPPAPRPDRGSLSPAQVHAFLRCIETGRNRLRNRALAYLLLATGIRLGEAARLQLSDVNEGLIHVRAATSKVRRSRIVPLGVQAHKAVQEYVLFGRQGSIEPTLFLSESGGPISLRGIQMVIKRAARRAGLQVGPHLLRHTFATQSLIQGASAFHIKSMLGHSTLSSTEIYMDMAAVQEAATRQRYSPLDRLL